MSRSPNRLTPTEVAAVEERWRAGAGGHRNRRLQSTGCLSAFVGMAALTLTPALAAWLPIHPALAYLILGLSVVFLFGGAAMGLLAASRAGAADRAAIEGAVVALLEAGADGEASVEAATILLLRLREAGPGEIPPDLQTRLTPVANQLRRVEAHLVERRLVPPRSS